MADVPLPELLEDIEAYTMPALASDPTPAPAPRGRGMAIPPLASRP